MSYLVDKAVLSGRQTFGHDGRGRDTNYTRLGSTRATRVTLITRFCLQVGNSLMYKQTIQLQMKKV